MNEDLPLGRRTPYPARYDPALLRSIPRTAARGELGIGERLPFAGEDVWNCYELSWLAPNGMPRIGVLRLRVPCASPALVESKSLKLYLNSFAQSPFDAGEAVVSTIAADLAKTTGASVAATLAAPDELAAPGDFRSFCLDELAEGAQQARIHRYRRDPTLLKPTGETGADAVHTHLLRTVCPITGQPDWGAIRIAWRGRLLDRAGLLAYLVSYRETAHFHEHAVEQIFVDVANAAQPSELTVDSRFLRRGGIDINPFRAMPPRAAPELRLHRQ